MSFRGRHVQRRIAALVLAVQISPGADERFGHFHISFRHRCVQRRHAVLIFNINVKSHVNQRHDDRQIFLCNG